MTHKCLNNLSHNSDKHIFCLVSSIMQEATSRGEGAIVQRHLLSKNWFTATSAPGVIIQIRGLEKKRHLTHSFDTRNMSTSMNLVVRPRNVMLKYLNFKHTPLRPQDSNQIIIIENIGYQTTKGHTWYAEFLLTNMSYKAVLFVLVNKKKSATIKRDFHILMTKLSSYHHDK